MRKLIFPFPFLLLFSIYLFSYSGNTNSIVRYFNSADVNKLGSLCEILESDSNSTPFDKHYCAGFIHNFLGEYYLNIQPDLSEEHLEQAIKNLEMAVIDNPSAEIFALLASAYGKMVAHVSIFSKMSTGNKAQHFIDKATKLDSSNIYVKYVDAVGLMRRPGLFGGDKEKARNMLNELLQNLESYDQPVMRWISEPLLLYRLWQISDALDETDKKLHLENKLENDFPNFNLER